MLNKCPKCTSNEWDHANVGLIGAIVCTNCGEIYMMKEELTMTNDQTIMDAAYWEYMEIGTQNGFEKAIINLEKKRNKPWVEITKGQIDDCLKHSDNYDFAWAIEHICRLNNGYPPHENFKPEVSGSIKGSKP